MTDRLKLTRRASLLMPLALGGCGMFDWLSDEQKKPIPGDREAVLAPSHALTVDATGSVSLPAVTRNADWLQYDGGPTHVGGNLDGGLTKAWSSGIGSGGDYRARLTGQPLVSGGSVFTMDTDGAVSAFDLAAGRRIWNTPTKPADNMTSNVGGGIGIAGGKLYAATGRAELVVMDLDAGGILWRAPLTSPARSAPTIAGDRLFVTTLDQELLALSTADGTVIWNYQASFTNSGMLTQTAPAYADGVVVAGFESGDLAGVRADSGTLAWSDNLGAIKGATGLSEFASVRGAPVIDAGIVYAIGLGGLMVALDLRSGRRVWERNVGGSHTPWIAGDFLFLVSVEQKVAALSKDDGTVFWVTQLKRFKNEKRTKGLINWTGPALVAGKLILLSDDEKMVVIDPVDGSIVSTTGISAAGSMGPTIAQGTVLILTDDATLTAYR